MAQALYRPAGGGAANAFDLGRLMSREGVEVWPDNWPAVALFLRLETQWRVGMGGPTGLDYCAVLAMVDRLGLAPDDADALFEDVRHLERAALAAIRESAQ